MELEPDVIDNYQLTFHEHMAEFFRRVLYINIGSLFSGLVGFLLSDKLASLLYAVADLGTSTHAAHPALTFTDKVLLAAVVSLVAFHHLLLSQFYAFMSPGLYPQERRTFLVPRLWAHLAPLMAFGFLAIYSVVISRLQQPPLSDLASIRGWLLKFYCVTALSTFLLALPRQKRSLTLSAFTILCLIILVLPHHVFDTLNLVLLELCLIASVVDGIVLSIWSDKDVIRTIAAESYLGTHGE